MHIFITSQLAPYASMLFHFLNTFKENVINESTIIPYLLSFISFTIIDGILRVILETNVIR